MGRVEQLIHRTSETRLPQVSAQGLFGANYSAAIDVPKFAEFLKLSGMKPRRIAKQRIVLSRILDKQTQGDYKSNTIELALDTINRAGGNPNDTLLHEAKHAIDDGKVAARLLDFIYSIVETYGLGVPLFPVLTTTTNIPTAIVGAISVLTSSLNGVIQMRDPHFFYFHRPSERRAYAFEDRFKNDPEWQGMIKLTSRM